MKVSRILCSTVLFGLALGFSAVSARADGTDPTVKVQRTPTDPVCNPGDPNCLVAGGNTSLVLGPNSSQAIDIGGTQDVFSLTVTFAGVEGDQYNCFTDVFTNCFVQINLTPGGGFTVTDLFNDDGNPLSPEPACQSNGDEIPAGNCPGFLAPGDEITIQGIGFTSGTTAFVNAPEPGTVLLMGLGLVALLGVSRKRIASSFPA
jgi:hypothetical protein